MADDDTEARPGQAGPAPENEGPVSAPQPATEAAAPAPKQQPERPAPELGPAGKAAKAALLGGVAGSEAWDAGSPPGVKVAPGDMVAAAGMLAGLGWRLDSYTAVDRIERLELVAHAVGPGSELFSLRCEVPAGEGDSPSLETLTGIWPSANWLEREIYDLFGVRFEGHPDLRRVALIDDFVGHPLRKSFPLDVVGEAAETEAIGTKGAAETKAAGTNEVAEE